MAIIFADATKKSAACLHLMVRCGPLICARPARCQRLRVQIPVSMAGVVNTGAITRSYNQVVCNAPTDITMTSQNGGLVNTVPASGGRTNVIPYSAQASFGGATSTLNTAASSMVTGKLNTTTGANGTMNVSISAQQPALPMMTGAYNDRLTITLTPQ